MLVQYKIEHYFAFFFKIMQNEFLFFIDLIKFYGFIEF